MKMCVRNQARSPYLKFLILGLSFQTWWYLVGLTVGTTKKVNLESNVGALAVKLSKEDMEEIEAAIPPHVIAGEKQVQAYVQITWKHVASPPLDTWKPHAK